MFKASVSGSQTHLAEAGNGAVYLLLAGACHNMPGLFPAPWLAFMRLTMKNHAEGRGNLHRKDASLSSASHPHDAGNSFVISASQHV